MTCFQFLSYYNWELRAFISSKVQRRFQNIQKLFRKFKSISISSIRCLKFRTSLHIFELKLWIKFAWWILRFSKYSNFQFNESPGIFSFLIECITTQLSLLTQFNYYHPHNLQLSTCDESNNNKWLELFKYTRDFFNYRNCSLRSI